MLRELADADYDVESAGWQREQEDALTHALAALDRLAALREQVEALKQDAEVALTDRESPRPWYAGEAAAYASVLALLDAPGAQGES